MLEVKGSQITAKWGGHTLSLIPYLKIATFDGREVKLPFPPILLADQLFVPTTILVKLGLQVRIPEKDDNSSEQTVSITPGGSVQGVNCTDIGWIEPGFVDLQGDHQRELVLEYIHEVPWDKELVEVEDDFSDIGGNIWIVKGTQERWRYQFDNRNSFDMITTGANLIGGAGQDLVVSGYWNGAYPGSGHYLIVHWDGRAYRLVLDIESDVGDQGLFYRKAVNNHPARVLRFWYEWTDGEAHVSPHYFFTCQYVWHHGRFVPTIIRKTRWVSYPDLAAKELQVKWPLLIPFYE